MEGLSYIEDSCEDTEELDETSKNNGDNDKIYGLVALHSNKEFEKSAFKPTSSSLNIKSVGINKNSLSSESEDEFPLFSKTSRKVKEIGKTNYFLIIYLFS